MEKEVQEGEIQILLLETAEPEEQEVVSTQTDMVLTEMMGKKVRMELWF